MTYNFDPDRWYENELAALELLCKKGEMDDAGFKNALKDLERRYEAMLDRLDNTYQLPESSDQQR